MEALTVRDTPAVRPGMAMTEIVAVMRAVDEGRVELTFDQMHDLARFAQQLPDSCEWVDVYQWLVELLEGREATIKSRIEVFQDLKKKISAKREAIEAEVLEVMRAKRFKKAVGIDHKVKLNRSDRVETLVDADEDAYASYGPYMRMKYEWDKVAIKAALKKDPKSLLGVAQLQPTESISFDLRGKSEIEGDTVADDALEVEAANVLPQ